MSEKNKLHTGELYLPGDKEITDYQTQCLERLYEYNATRPGEYAKRTALLKMMFATIGEGCYSEPPFHSAPARACPPRPSDERTHPTHCPGASTRQKSPSPSPSGFPVNECAYFFSFCVTRQKYCPPARCGQPGYTWRYPGDPRPGGRLFCPAPGGIPESCAGQCSCCLCRW